MAKNPDLQPWADYFRVLQSYETDGYLELKPDLHEAYITQPALFALTGAVTQEDFTTARTLKQVKRIVRWIKAYAAFKSVAGSEYLQGNFAVHVVKPEPPHDMLYTLLLTERRRWFCPFRKIVSIEVVTY